MAYILRSKGQFDPNRIRTCRNWSDFGCKNDDETEFIPTVLAFPKGKSLLDGFPEQCGKLTKEQREDKSLEVYEWFKVDFPGNLRVRTSSRDPGHTVTRMASHSVDNADSTDTMILYRHFLTQLYNAVQGEIKGELEKNGLPQWTEAHIEFIFSVPATWNRIDETLGRITSKLEKVVNLAGFGKIDGHSVNFGLTEPEAAASYSLAPSTLDKQVSMKETPYLKI